MASSSLDPQTWCTIESDPGIFTELIEMIGVKDVGVEELYSLDEELMHEAAPIYGLVFLFKWQDEKDERVPESEYPGVFFANQVVQNACATQALLSILLNIDESEVDIGEELRNFKKFTEAMPPELKGFSLSNATTIRTAHNSFRPPDTSLRLKASKKGKKEDAYHYVSYVPINGKLYELDGLKAGPIVVAECTKDNWLGVARRYLQQRVERNSAEDMFNLLAVNKSKAVTLQQRLVALQELGSHAPPGALEETQEQLKSFVEKRENWRKENIRRRHDYTAFIVNLLTLLAEGGHLKPLLDQAIEEHGDSFIHH